MKNSLTSPLNLLAAASGTALFVSLLFAAMPVSARAATSGVSTVPAEHRLDDREPKVLLARIDALITGVDNKLKQIEEPSIKRDIQRQLSGFKMRRDALDDTYDGELAEALLTDLAATWERLQNPEAA